MLRKLSAYFTLPGAIGFAWWLLDHLLPDLLPKIPHRNAVAIAAAAGALMACALIITGWRRLTEYVPRPWLPRPIWRMLYWLRHRPSVSIILAVPKVEFGVTTVEECTIKLTMWRNLTRSIEAATIRFDGSVLVMRNIGVRRGKRHYFRPRETGGLLNLPVPGNSVDSVMVEYVATGLPSRTRDAPDFSTDYELELSGIVAQIDGKTSLNAILPPAQWQMIVEAYRANNNPYQAK